MRRLISCAAGLMLLLAVLLAALSPVVVATARRGMLMAPSRDDEGRGRAGAANSLGDAPEAAAAANGGEDVIGRRKDDEVVVRTLGSHRRFRTRRIPASSQPQVHFGGRIPFTADYHSVHRHPPAHN